jgi:hypothetical protein
VPDRQKKYRDPKRSNQRANQQDCSRDFHFVMLRRSATIRAVCNWNRAPIGYPILRRILFVTSFRSGKLRRSSNVTALVCRASTDCSASIRTGLLTLGFFPRKSAFIVDASKRLSSGLSWLSIRSKAALLGGTGSATSVVSTRSSCSETKYFPFASTSLATSLLDTNVGSLNFGLKACGRGPKVISVDKWPDCSIVAG